MQLQISTRLIKYDKKKLHTDQQRTIQGGQGQLPHR
jgi:hypothetical protein